MDASSPYEDLYIYYLQGRAPDQKLFGPDYIGCWHEDFVDSPYDLVIANIHYDVMKHLVGAQGFLDKEWFILSGSCAPRPKILPTDYPGIMSKS